MAQAGLNQESRDKDRTKSTDLIKGGKRRCIGSELSSGYLLHTSCIPQRHLSTSPTSTSRNHALRHTAPKPDLSSLAAPCTYYFLPTASCTMQALSVRSGPPIIYSTSLERHWLVGARARYERLGGLVGAIVQRSNDGASGRPVVMHQYWRSFSKEHARSDPNIPRSQKKAAHPDPVGCGVAGKPSLHDYLLPT